MIKHKLTFLETLAVLGVSISRNFKLLARFKISFVFIIISSLFSVAIFFFISQMMEIKDYFPYVLIGLAINQYTMIAITTYLGTIRNTYWDNQLELILSSPTRLKTFFFATLLWSFIYATINVLIYFIIGIGVFGAHIAFPYHWYVIVLVLFLVIVSLSGIGLISASMFLLLNAKGEIEPISWIITTLSGLFAGVYFPVERLPVEIQGISMILPQTHALKAIRDVFNGHGLEYPEIQICILYLIIFLVILFPLGLWIFKKGVQKAERDGTLARWA